MQEGGRLASASVFVRDKAMARKKMVTSRDMCKMRVFGGRRRTKRIGKVKSCVFHPSEKRCVGFMVKRPDLLWMFHRKDLFVALDGFDLIDGRIVVKDEGDMTGPAACRRMGIDWDRCVIWEGMPLMTIDGTAIGCVGNISFSLHSGEIESVEASNGATAKYLLGTLEIPVEYIKGFKRGMGVDLVVKEDSREAGEQEQFKGAIIVSDDVWELSPEGGWAESAGEFTAKARARMHEAARNKGNHDLQKLHAQQDQNTSRTCIANVLDNPFYSARLSEFQNKRSNGHAHHGHQHEKRNQAAEFEKVGLGKARKRRTIRHGLLKLFLELPKTLFL